MTENLENGPEIFKDYKHESECLKKLKSKISSDVNDIISTHNCYEQFKGINFEKDRIEINIRIKHNEVLSMGVIKEVEQYFDSSSGLKIVDDETIKLFIII